MLFRSLNGDGTMAHQLPDWEEELRLTTWERTGDGWRCVPGEICKLEPFPSDTWHAMVTGLRDYVNANRFPGVVLGMSGGIDSAICAAIAADALGPERVWCVMLPSRFTSQESLDDAAEAASMIGCRIDTIPISPAVEAFDEMLADSFADKAVDLTEENLQSRIRGVTLMALSNKFGPMLMTTGNKSEMSVGYATIYGDMAGGYNPIKDAYKMTVFALAKWRNANKPRIGLGPDGPVMPERIITKPPSAELRPDQKDSDSLPDYPILDPILLGLVEALGAGYLGALTGGVGEPQAPVVREPEIVVAEAPVEPAASNPQASLQSAPATPAPTKPAAKPAPAPATASPTPANPAPATPTPTTEPAAEPAPSAPARTEPAAPAKPSLTTTLDGKDGLKLPSLPSLPKLPGQQGLQTQLQPGTQAAAPQEAPATPSQPEPTAQPQAQAQAQVQARVAPPAQPPIFFATAGSIDRRANSRTRPSTFGFSEGPTIRNASPFSPATARTVS